MRARRLDPAPLLREAGLGRDVLEDARVRVPVASYAALYNAVVRHLGDEAFGLFHAPLRTGAFEFLCRGAIGSADLAAALERAARFLRLVLPGIEIHLEREARQARLVIAERRPLQRRANDPRRVFAFEWLLRLLHGLACWLAARPLPMEEVRFPFPAPAHAADYALIYAERSRFGADALVATFDAALMALPVRREASDVDAFIEGGPGKIVMLYRRDREAARAVRELLAHSLAAAPGFDAAARALNVSPRTLHRRLREEGTSFRAIKAALRRDLALARLEKTRERVADIAAELGYSEPSAFFRAFHGWTGEAPTVHRRRTRGMA
ncbi:MAG TPA: AraC family transcriptional regulator ligand-binding domain-containing protein [Usitatibacter sp.]|nr:AraC family transcriptional regulator ligand-binding domain-containing protein [Usitatibacter sp.]